MPVKFAAFVSEAFQGPKDINAIWFHLNFTHKPDCYVGVTARISCVKMGVDRSCELMGTSAFEEFLPLPSPPLPSTSYPSCVGIPYYTLYSADGVTVTFKFYGQCFVGIRAAGRYHIRHISFYSSVRKVSVSSSNAAIRYFLLVFWLANDK